MTLQASAYIPCDEPITFEELPQVAQTFIKDTFNNLTVTRASYNSTSSEKIYEVAFSDNTLITFDEVGNWTEINRNDAEIPVLLIPEPILEWLSIHNFGLSVSRIKKAENHICLELFNNETLTFDSEYQLIETEPDTIDTIEE